MPKPHLMSGTWLATRDSEHYFWHNKATSLCRKASRENVLLNYINVNHCEACLKAVARLGTKGQK